MSLAIVFSRAEVGIDAPLVSVEVHLSNGLPNLSIVGLPEAAVKESKDRVRGAILNSRFEFPIRRITINLAPADLPKEGGRFDLPIALGILAASGQIPREPLGQYELLGELALGGELRGIRGVLPAALACRAAGRPCWFPAITPMRLRWSAALRFSAPVHLLEICAHLRDGASAPASRQPAAAATTPGIGIWPKCAASIMPSAPWKSPRPAVTTCC